MLQNDSAIEQNENPAEERSEVHGEAEEHPYQADVEKIEPQAVEAIKLDVPITEESVGNLEKTMSEVFLDEKVTPADGPAQSDTPDEMKVEHEDIEMKEEQMVTPAESHTETPAEIPQLALDTNEQKVKQEDSFENYQDFMDIEDDSRYVRRSRRLQSVMEVAPVKAEDSIPEVTAEVIEPQEPAIVPTATPEPVTNTEDQKEEKPEAPAKPAQTQRIKVDMLDQRLRNYDTILDNIYSKKSDKKVCKANKTMKCDCTITEEEVKNGELGCMYNCINRLLYIECGLKCRCGEYCDNQQFQRHNYSPCSVFDTTNKGFGIKADEDIPAETFVIEYVGEVLDQKQFEKRAKKYSENKNIHYYFMALKSNAIIDATKRGNISRFINHSCDPNAETQKWTVNGELRVGFFSRKDIKKGEEITFDYQYQRYGKEAQRCYCEAASCRGWIGENPIDDEELEEEDVENLEVEDTKTKKTKGRKGRKPKVAAQEMEIKDESESEENEVKAPVKRREIVRKIAPKSKKRQEYDDLEIEGEINDLTESGLKNRANTIRLSRLFVRAKNVDARVRLLKILINGDMPCRRLFLDYHGLKLFHSWMSDLKTNSIADLSLCIEMMNALEILPITNKTVLRTSKVLDRVEKWKNLDPEKKEKKKLTKEEKKLAKAEKKKNKGGDLKQDEQSEEGVTSESMVDGDAEQSKENVDTITAPDENAVDELTEMKVRVKKTASDLLEKWEDLKEDFKIPKKQKQEIMIEHEREADNDDWDDDPMLPRTDALSNDRYKNRFGDDPTHGGTNKNFTAPFKKNFDPMVSKQQRRQMFEMKVAQLDTEKRMIMLHENNCNIFGLNPTTTNPMDIPVRVNRVTGEYNTIDGRIAPPPPNHYQFKYEPLTLSTNPDDFHLPPIDLPDHWKFALDEYGRIYYYHEKIRQPQWEAPIKILPLTTPDSDAESPDSDESTTDTEDSELEELQELLEMLKRKKNLPSAQQGNSNPLIIQPEGDEDDLEKKIMSNMMKNPLDQPMKISQLPQKRMQKKRHGLTSMQFIRPRTESDKIYGRAESRRYKEVKEKLRQKKRRQLKGEPAPGDESTEEDDDIQLDDSIENRKFVDELDILEKSDFEKAKKEIEKKMKKPKPVPVDHVEIKRQFRDDIKVEIAKYLHSYREGSCENGKITNDIDFNSLVNKVRSCISLIKSKTF